MRKFLRVDIISKSYFGQKSKQEFKTVNITFFAGKESGAFIRAGDLLGEIWYLLKSKSELE